MTTLAQYTRPADYSGPSWDGWLVAPCAIHRDSPILDVSNWDTMCAALEAHDDGQTAVNSYGDECPTVAYVRSSHWAVGWVEVCYIHPSNVGAVGCAEKLASRLESYPILNEDDLGQREQDNANDVWRNCYTTTERLKAARAAHVDIYSLSAVIGPNSDCPDELRDRMNGY